MSWTKLAAAVGFPAFLVGCQSFLSFDRDAVSNAPPPAEQRADDGGSSPEVVSPAADGGVDASMIADGAATTHGPAMVFVVDDADTGDGFLVDTTAVTRVDFATYLASTNQGTNIDPNRPAACVSKTSFAVSEGPECAFLAGGLDREPTLAMSCVDWCTAWAYCRWSGKRLCGASEWPFACTATTENGPFDMGRNVSEWENGCSADNALCEMGGAPSVDASAGSECASSASAAPLAFAPTIGFRCCADATLGMPSVDGGEL